MNHIVLFSGGLGSWAAAKRVVERYGTRDTRLVFTDTLMEDCDLYRFLDDARAQLGVQLITLADGRDPWRVFFEKRFLGNSRVDLCSRILKRELWAKWRDKHLNSADTTVYVGIDWTESHRFDRIKERSAPWRIEAPLCDAPYLTKLQIRQMATECGLRVPRLYELGFDHNNCGGFCVRAGQAHFKNLLIQLPAVYEYHENREQEFREFIGKDVAIMKDRRGGGNRPLTMREFRERVQANCQIEADEWGGCSCFAGPEDEVAA